MSLLTLLQQRSAALEAGLALEADLALAPAALVRGLSVGLAVEAASALPLSIPLRASYAVELDQAAAPVLDQGVRAGFAPFALIQPKPEKVRAPLLLSMRPSWEFDDALALTLTLGLEVGLSSESSPYFREPTLRQLIAEATEAAELAFIGELDPNDAHDVIDLLEARGHDVAELRDLADLGALLHASGRDDDRHHAV